MRYVTKNYCFILDILLNDLKSEYAPDSGSFLIEKVNVVSASSQYSTRSALGQSSSAHEVFSERDMKNAVRLAGSVIRPKAYKHTIFLVLRFYR